MLKVPDKEISQSIQHNKEGKILNNNLTNTRSTPFRFTLELDGDIILEQVRLHPRSGSRTMNRSRINVRITGDLQPGLNSNIFKVEFINIGKLVPSRQEMIPTNSCHLVQVVVFFACRQLSIPWQSTGGVTRTLSHIACTYTDTLSAHQT